MYIFGRSNEPGVRYASPHKMYYHGYPLTSKPLVGRGGTEAGAGVFLVRVTCENVGFTWSWYAAWNSRTPTADISPQPAAGQPGSLFSEGTIRCAPEPRHIFAQQMASSSSPSVSSNRERERHGLSRSQQSPLPAHASSPPAPSGGGDRGCLGNNADRGNTPGGQGKRGEIPYQLPHYRHDAPWPRARPTAEAAAKARAGRRARADRGASTAADARAEMEDKVPVVLCRRSSNFLHCQTLVSGLSEQLSTSSSPTARCSRRPPCSEPTQNMCL